MKLRKWQQDALKLWNTNKRKDFLVVATPGAGKTTFALTCALIELKENRVEQIVVVAPTEHLKKQWADAASKLGIKLDPSWSAKNSLMSDYHGVIVTYAQVSLNFERHAKGVAAKKTLVILDEVHHAGDSLSWGEGVRTSFKPATKRLLLSGSPWRSDVNPIPFVSYHRHEDGVLRSKADYVYGYSDALKDSVVRPVAFLAYSGISRWEEDGITLESNLETITTKSITSRALRSALAPDSDWIGSVLGAADDKLNQLRKTIPDAGGLILASDKHHAKMYAKRLEAYIGEKVHVAVSEDPKASEVIENYAKSESKWLVAVRMVSEGVDIPRLAVGVYATNSATSLFFTQAIGRFVRARNAKESATIFIPATPGLLNLSSEIEKQRDHALKLKEEETSEALIAKANQNEKTFNAYEFKTLSSDAEFSLMIVNGAQYGSENFENLNDDSIDLESLKLITSEPEPLHKQIRETRRQLAKEVAAYSILTGSTHSSVHTYLRQICGGPPVAEATLEQLKARIRILTIGHETPESAIEEEEIGQLKLF